MEAKRLAKKAEDARVKAEAEAQRLKAIEEARIAKEAEEAERWAEEEASRIKAA